MAFAALLTALAVVGVAGGVWLHRGASTYLTASGGVILFLIASVWIVPEIAATWGWSRALICVGLVAGLFAFADALLLRLGHSPRRGVVAPLIAATAIHSLLDGWSIRTLGSHPLPIGIASIGLGLHKIPEGFALGWVLRKSLHSHIRAFALGVFAELFTLLGAALQPTADRSGLAWFGAAWTSAVLCVIAGAFVFLGLHTVLPYFRHEH
jgi:zinc transporter ZupT